MGNMKVLTRVKMAITVLQTSRTLDHAMVPAISMYGERSKLHKSSHVRHADELIS